MLAFNARSPRVLLLRVSFVPAQSHGNAHVIFVLHTSRAIRTAGVLFYKLLAFDAGCTTNSGYGHVRSFLLPIAM